jgi:hypothetical protein
LLAAGFLLDDDIPFPHLKQLRQFNRFGAQEIIARVSNRDNGDVPLEANIQVFESAVPAKDIPNLVFCDNTSVEPMWMAFF